MLVVFTFANYLHARHFKENRMRFRRKYQLEDSLSGICAVKGFAAEDHERKKFRATQH